jgi:hypothetical protein
LLAASLAATVLLVACAKTPQLPPCERACVYEPSEIVRVRVHAESWSVLGPGPHEASYPDAKAAAQGLQRQLTAWQADHKLPASQVLHVECPVTVDASRVGELLGHAVAWPATGKDPRPPTALALRSSRGSYVAVGFATEDVDSAEVLRLSGTCGDLVATLDRAAAQNRVLFVRR